MLHNLKLGVKALLSSLFSKVERLFKNNVLAPNNKKIQQNGINLNLAQRAENSSEYRWIEIDARRAEVELDRVQNINSYYANPIWILAAYSEAMTPQNTRNSSNNSSTAAITFYKIQKDLPSNLVLNISKLNEREYQQKAAYKKISQDEVNYILDIKDLRASSNNSDINVNTSNSVNNSITAKILDDNVVSTRNTVSDIDEIYLDKSNNIENIPNNIKTIEIKYNKANNDYTNKRDILNTNNTIVIKGISNNNSDSNSNNLGFKKFKFPKITTNNNNSDYVNNLSNLSGSVQNEQKIHLEQKVGDSVTDNTGTDQPNNTNKTNNTKIKDNEPKRELKKFFKSDKETTFSAVPGSFYNGDDIVETYKKFPQGSIKKKFLNTVEQFLNTVEQIYKESKNGYTRGYTIRKLIDTQNQLNELLKSKKNLLTKDFQTLSSTYDIPDLKQILNYADKEQRIFLTEYIKNLNKIKEQSSIKDNSIEQLINALVNWYNKYAHYNEKICQLKEQIESYESELNKVQLELLMKFASEYKITYNKHQTSDDVIPITIKKISDFLGKKLYNYMYREKDESVMDITNGSDAKMQKEIHIQMTSQKESKLIAVDIPSHIIETILYKLRQSALAAEPSDIVTNIPEHELDNNSIVFPLQCVLDEFIAAKIPMFRQLSVDSAFVYKIKNVLDDPNNTALNLDDDTKNEWTEQTNENFVITIGKLGKFAKYSQYAKLILVDLHKFYVMPDWDTALNLSVNTGYALTPLHKIIAVPIAVGEIGCGIYSTTGYIISGNFLNAAVEVVHTTFNVAFIATPYALAAIAAPASGSFYLLYIGLQTLSIGVSIYSIFSYWHLDELKAIKQYLHDTIVPTCKNHYSNANDLTIEQKEKASKNCENMYKVDETSIKNNVRIAVDKFELSGKREVHNCSVYVKLNDKEDHNLLDHELDKTEQSAEQSDVVTSICYDIIKGTIHAQLTDSVIFF